MDRYFIVSYFFTTKDNGFSFGNSMIATTNTYVNRKSFIENIKDEFINTTSVSIISIMEVSKEDYENFKE